MENQICATKIVKKVVNVFQKSMKVLILVVFGGTREMMAVKIGNKIDVYIVPIKDFLMSGNKSDYLEMIKAKSNYQI